MLQPLKLLLLFMLAGGPAQVSAQIADPDIARFVTAKRAQAKELGAAQTNAVPDGVWKFFDAVERNDWAVATNQFDKLQQLSGRLGNSDRQDPALNTEMWAPISETFGVFELHHDWDKKWLRRFGRDIISSIPNDSIYFGGTDPGRFVISALSDSHREGRPFFTLTQNQLADGTHLEYLRAMYGKKIKIPTTEESAQAFKEYLDDAVVRQQENKLKPGEDVRIVNNRVQVSGQVAVMTINGLLVKIIVDKNPGREIYVEESFPLDWMYPHLAPHGLIMKLNRKPVPELSESVLQRDRDFWKRYTKELIGDWIEADTSVKEVCDFGEKVYLRKNLTGFAGDRGFATNSAAQKTFSKLRSSIAGVYAWRAEHADASAEKKRMTQEADLALRQALALCPYSPEAAFRYVNLLIANKRHDDARLVAQLFQKLSPDDPNTKDLMERVRKLK